jgi:1,4-alpha-glucan branching enzyme
MMSVKQKELSSKKANPDNSSVFVCKLNPDAKEVYLAGEFNDWDTRADRMVKRKGEFRKTLRLAPGEYQYRFIVDGQWHSHPSAAAEVPNEFGTTNSIIRVRKASKK